MPLEFADVTKAKLIDVNPRSEKHGPTDLQPAIDLRFQVDCSNEVLKQYHPELLDLLYEDTGQMQLDAVEKTAERATLRLPQLAMPLHWSEESIGNDLTVDYGIGGESDLSLLGCRVHKHVITAKQGGTCTIAFTVSCAHDLTKDVVGALGTRVQHDIYIKLHPSPEERIS